MHRAWPVHANASALDAAERRILLAYILHNAAAGSSFLSARDDYEPEFPSSDGSGCGGHGGVRVQWRQRERLADLHVPRYW